MKSSPDKFLDIVVITGSAALFSAAVLPFLSLPRPASWSCVAASAVIHVAYFLLTGASYRTGDMSQAYPLMRGGPPLLVALASGPLIGQHLGAGEWAGIVLISGGLLALVFMERGAAALSGSAMRFALINVVVIASYLLIDGTGARLSGNPVAYTMWIFLLTAPAIVGWSLLRRRADLARHLGSRWHLGLTGGAFTLGAYVLVLWAMTHAPVAVVAALREAAILFGMAISAFVLKERFGWSRTVAAVIILVGMTTIRLA